MATEGNLRHFVGYGCCGKDDENSVGCLWECCNGVVGIGHYESCENYGVRCRIWLVYYLLTTRLPWNRLKMAVSFHEFPQNPEILTFSTGKKHVSWWNVVIFVWILCIVVKWCHSGLRKIEFGWIGVELSWKLLFDVSGLHFETILCKLFVVRNLEFRLDVVVVIQRLESVQHWISRG